RDGRDTALAVTRHAIALDERAHRALVRHARGRVRLALVLGLDRPVAAPDAHHGDHEQDEEALATRGEHGRREHTRTHASPRATVAANAIHALFARSPEGRAPREL